VQRLKQSFEVMKCKVRESEEKNLMIRPLDVGCDSN
jgi:hypothetical protein